jgi:uncharacterized protein
VNRDRNATETIVSIWRYPVKSMMGEELNSSYVTERGLLGDRTYALIYKTTGKVASAKNPSKWGKLFDFRSLFIKTHHKPLRIFHQSGLPCQMAPTFSPIRMILIKPCQRLGRDVRLTRASSLHKPSYEEYWPDTDGLAQREKITDETMPSQTFFDIAVIHLDYFYNQPSARTLSRRALQGSTVPAKDSDGVSVRREGLYREFMNEQEDNDRRRYCA